MSEIPSDVINVEMVNELSEIERLSLIIDEFVERNGLSPKVAFELNVALDEILTNVITHGYDDSGPYPIQVRGRLEDGFMTIEVEDGGREFDPLKASEPDLDSGVEERPIGGLGIHLVRQLTDRLEYRRLEGRNLLTMWKAARPQTAC